MKPDLDNIEPLRRSGRTHKEFAKDCQEAAVATHNLLEQLKVKEERLHCELALGPNFIYRAKVAYSDAVKQMGEALIDLDRAVQLMGDYETSSDEIKGKDAYDPALNKCPNCGRQRHDKTKKKCYLC